MFGGGTKAGAPPSWRFHSSGFATGSNAEMAVVGRQPHAAAASSSSTAFASTTTTTTATATTTATTMDTTLLPPPPHPGDHLRGGGANKRPLASCREELERGWQRHRCVSNDRVSSSWLAKDDDDDDDEIITDDDDVANDDDMSSGNGSGNNRVKRRRIASPPIRNRAGGMMEGEEDAAMMTTTTDDGSSSSSSTMTWTDGSSSLVVTRRAVRIARCDPRRQIKPGWYDGPVDDYGNRHGRGVTRHDDGTTYEGPYANDVMAGSGGRYTLPTRHELVVARRRPGDGADADDGNLLRRVEVRFEGSFRDDVPHGVGTTITATIDCVAAGRPAKTEIASAEVTYDVGVHDSRKSEAVGEGARVAYRRIIVRPPDDRYRSDADGGGGGDGGGTGTTGGVAPPQPPSSSSSWERSCYRLINGRDAGMKVADGYAAWIVQCMGVDFPGPPSSASS